MREKIFEDLLTIWAKAKVRLKKSDKWETVTELCNLFYDFNLEEYEDDEVYDKLNAKMHYVCEAPHIGYFVYIYRYKGILVAVQDIPHAPEITFYSVVTYKDYVIAKINDFWNRVGQTLLKKSKWERINQ